MGGRPDECVELHLHDHSASQHGRFEPWCPAHHTNRADHPARDGSLDADHGGDDYPGVVERLLVVLGPDLLLATHIDRHAIPGVG